MLGCGQDLQTTAVRPLPMHVAGPSLSGALVPPTSRRHDAHPPLPCPPLLSPRGLQDSLPATAVQASALYSIGMAAVVLQLLAQPLDVLDGERLLYQLLAFTIVGCGCGRQRVATRGYQPERAYRYRTRYLVQMHPYHFI